MDALAHRISDFIQSTPAEDNGFEPEDGSGIQLETLTVELPAPDELQRKEELEPEAEPSPLKSLNWTKKLEEVEGTDVATRFIKYACISRASP